MKCGATHGTRSGQLMSTRHLLTFLVRPLLPHVKCKTPCIFLNGCQGICTEPHAACLQLRQTLKRERPRLLQFVVGRRPPAVRLLSRLWRLTLPATACTCPKGYKKGGGRSRIKSVKYRETYRFCNFSSFSSELNPFVPPWTMFIKPWGLQNRTAI